MTETPSFFACLFRNRAKRWWVVGFALAILAVAWLANLHTMDNCLQQTPGQHDMVDFQLSGLDGSTASLMFDWETQILCHGVSRPAREVAVIAISRDWGFILVYVALGIALIGGAGRSCSWRRRWRHGLAALVIGAGIADVLENTLLLNFVLTSAEVNLSMAQIAALAALTKFTLLGIVALIAGGKFLFCLYRCRRA